MLWPKDRFRLVTCLLLGATLLGCKSDQGGFQGTNVWIPSPIKRPPDAIQLAVQGAESEPVSSPNIADPRDWNALDDSQAWYLSLSEALAIGLENSPIVRTLPDTQSQIGATSRRIDRTTVFDPQIAETEIEAELGRFDARLEALVLAHPEEYPPNTAPNGTSDRPPKLDRATAEFGLVKPSITGGELGVFLDNAYRYIPPRFNRQAVNPQYQPEFGLELSQPILRDAGRRINLNPVVIVAAEAQQSDWELRADVLGMVRSIETVYWSLYEQRGLVQTIDRVIPLLDEAVRLADANVRADLAIPADVAQAETLLFDFRQRRVQALANVRQQESLLRDLIGLSATADQIIMTANPPLPESPNIDWETTIETAIAKRPDISRQRLSVHAARLAAEIAVNRTLPGLDAIASYRVKGLGADLSRALDVLGDVEFNDWAVGLLFDYPLGNREARAQARAARLVVEREEAKLQETVRASTHELSQLVYEVDAIYRQYELAEQRYQANDRWLRGARARYLNPTGDATLARSLDLYLRAIRSSAESQQELITLRSLYQRVFARLLEAEGTLLELRQIKLGFVPEEQNSSRSDWSDLLSPSFTGEGIKVRGPSGQSLEKEDVGMRPEPFEGELERLPLVPAASEPAVTEDDDHVAPIERLPLPRIE